MIIYFLVLILVPSKMVSTFFGWLIEAEGLSSHDVVCHGVGARTGSTTDSSVFANSTLIPQTVRIAEKLKSWMLSVDSCKRITANISGRKWKKSTGIDLTGVRNKNITVTCVHPFRCMTDAPVWAEITSQAAGQPYFRRFFPTRLVFCLLLNNVSPVVWCFCNLNYEINLFRKTIKPLE